MEPALELLLDFLAGQVPQAPGSEASTRRALAALGPLPERPRVADLGCGRGASALVLAEATGGEVLAVDLLPQMVAAVRERAEEAGLERLRAVEGDMLRPPVEPGSLELIWSEGAAYSVGVSEALEAWHPLLVPGGGLVLSELVWRAELPSEEARAFWAQGYPGMGSAADFLALVEARGFRLLESFFLPESDWAAYYEPQAARLEGWLEAHPGPTAAAVAEEMAGEIPAWRRFGDQVGYLVAVARRA